MGLPKRCSNHFYEGCVAFDFFFMGMALKVQRENLEAIALHHISVF